jgi:hypothetical protein
MPAGSCAAASRSSAARASACTMAWYARAKAVRRAVQKKPSRECSPRSPARPMVRCSRSKVRHVSVERPCASYLQRHPY